MTDSRGTVTAEAIPASLTTLLGFMRDGVVLINRDRRISYLNGEASHRLGLDTSVLVGERPFVPPASSDTVEVELDIDGEPYTAVIVRDDTRSVALDQRRLVAFTRTTARAACMGSLQSTLNAVAAEVLNVTAAVSCTLTLTDPEAGETWIEGEAGVPPEHWSKVQAALRLGAPLLALAAAKGRSPYMERDLRRRMRDDVRLAPLAPIVEQGHWKSLVAVPMVVRDVSLGALTAYYPAPAHPDEAEVAFISAMADQAAIAVNTARLFADAQEKAALEERNRLARDLHDSVSQNLYSLVLQARAAQSTAARIQGADGAMMRERLQTLYTLAEAALDDMRSAILQLREPATMGDSGLTAAVREHAAAVARREGTDISVSIPDEPLLLSLETEHELFRVISEALTNSMRHARATHVEIRIIEPDDRNELVVTVTDNGTGFDTSRHRPGHVGLVSMRERTERLGGRLFVETSGEGTTVRAVVPCRRWPTGSASQ